MLGYGEIFSVNVVWKDLSWLTLNIYFAYHYPIRNMWLCRFKDDTREFELIITLSPAYSATLLLGWSEYLLALYILYQIEIVYMTIWLVKYDQIMC